jgi:hypothetical protein
MIRTLFILTLTVAAAAMLTQQPKQEKSPVASAPAQAVQTPAAPAAPAPTISPNQPVIMIHGVCGAGSTSKSAATPDPASCTRSVTKEQFEKVLGYLNANTPRITPAQRRQIAQGYVSMLAYALAAQKAGMESDPKFIELMEFVRLRTLAETYKREQQEKYGTPPPEDIEAYYKQHLDQFEDVKVRRIFIPKNNPSAPKPAPEVNDAKAAGEDAAVFAKKAQDVAHEIRERAAKGEDPTALVTEAYATLGISSAPASTDAFSYRKGMIPAQEEQDFLSAGPSSVSKVQSEPGGFLIYKLESKEPRPFEQVKAQISSTLSRQILEEKTNEIMSGVQSELNDQYFGPPPAASVPSAPLPRGVSHSPGTPNH